MRFEAACGPIVIRGSQQVSKPLESHSLRFYQLSFKIQSFTFYLILFSVKYTIDRVFTTLSVEVHRNLLGQKQLHRHRWRSRPGKPSLCRFQPSTRPSRPTLTIANKIEEDGYPSYEYPHNYFTERHCQADKTYG